MNFPDFITVAVFKNRSGQPVGGKAVMIKLKMQRKNDHNIGPKFTNGSGVVVFTKTEIIEEIDATINGSPMDYSGGIECCKSVEAIAMGREAIARLINARKIWGEASPLWKLSDTTIRALQETLIKIRRQNPLSRKP